MIDKFINKIFNTNESNFDEIALEIFYYQAKNNPVYKSFIDASGINCLNIDSIEKIPFLPISFFKTHQVLVGNLEYQTVFISSGTSSDQSARHYVYSTELYKESFLRTFKRFFGEPEDYCILALLPSYLERGNSSLVYMVNELIQQSEHNGSGFYLYDFASLNTKIEIVKKTKAKIIFLGVAFALIDFCSDYQPDLSGHITIETGGMKGRKREMMREELHEILCKSFNQENIYSEYGMTELLSQAYSLNDGVFNSANWMRVMSRDRYDPYNILDDCETGLLNIIDLSNVASCSFIATDDVGFSMNTTQFKVTGRADFSPLRGCNLMYE